MTRWLLFAALLSLGGCTMTYTDPTLSDDNPANPAALESPPPPRPSTLDLAAAEPINAPKKESSHAGHSMSDMKTPPQSDSPAGAAQSASTQSQTDTPRPHALYVCPMHPEVTSDKPDQRCPKCGMKLKSPSAIKAKQGESK